MNVPGIKLTTYFAERDRAGSSFLADALLDVYERHRIHTSVLLRGVEGFGQHARLQTDSLLTLSENLPAVSIAIDERDRIERALRGVLDVATHGVISLERARLVTGDDLGRATLADDPGQGIKLTLYGGRSVRTDGRAGYVAAVDVLRSAGAAGASILLAVDGMLHGERQRARFFARNANVPLMLLAIGTAASLTSALPDLRGLLTDPVATIERVQICKVDGMRLSEPLAVSETDHSGLPVWQKVMIHAEEQSKVDGHPLHRELVRRLREAGAAGATVLRGARGFYANRDVFADSLLSLRRNVPVHLVVVDTPGNTRRLWPIIDEATRETGLVTSELVPASHAFPADAPPDLKLASTPTATDR
jgi:PII-like signaling protein